MGNMQLHFPMMGMMNDNNTKTGFFGIDPSTQFNKFAQFSSTHNKGDEMSCDEMRRGTDPHSFLIII